MPEDRELAEMIPRQAMRLWLTRFHRDALSREFLVFALKGIDTFTKRWPEAAVEISKDVGWPDDASQNADGSDPGVQRVRPVPSGPTG